MRLTYIFGKNLKWYRFQKNYTQAELAEKTELSISYISQLERGKHSVDFNIIERLCNVLNIEPFQLFLKPNNKELPRRIDMKK